MHTIDKNTLLTDRQQSVLNFIRQFQINNGFTPSQREIAEHFGYASDTAAVGHLNALEKKGWIKRDPTKARSLVIQGEASSKNLINFPIYGSIAAGFPTEEAQQSLGCIAVDMDTVRLPKGAKVFALNVRGDSMIDAGIFEGDTVLLEFRESNNKDIVAALIDGETTLKRLITRNGKSFLKAENAKYKDLIPAQELVIQGVMVGLLRLLKR